MAISVTEFLRQSKFKRTRSSKCPKCRRIFRGTDRLEAKEAQAYYNGKLVHVDCYYGSLGKHLDKNPIASGRVRRG